jgi:predicted PurR-regulated permease PerM
MPARLPWPLVFQILGVIGTVWLVIHTWHVWLLCLIALVLAAAMLPAARLLERHRVPRGPPCSASTSSRPRCWC